MSKKRKPIWIRFFLVSVMMLVLAFFAVSLVFIINMRENENQLITSSISKSISYTENNLGNTLEGYRSQITDLSVSGQFYGLDENEAGYVNHVRSILETIYKRIPNTFSVAFQNQSGKIFSVGESTNSVKKQEELINACKRNAAFYPCEGIWIYDQSGRNKNALVLCNQIVYVDYNFNKKEIGTLLVYFDIKQLNNYIMLPNDGADTLVCDSNNMVLFSSDVQMIGKNVDELLKPIDESTAQMNQKECFLYTRSMLSDQLRIVSYFDKRGTNENLIQTLQRLTLYILILLGCIGAITYGLSKKVARPIEELLKDIKVNEAGDVIRSEESESEGDIEILRSFITSLQETTKKHVEENYKMQVQLRDITIKAYENCINPHFLFNTLQMLRILNEMEEKKSVSEVITCLSNLFRFNLEQRKLVPLSAEVDNIRNYLKIIDLRFHDRFAYQIMIPDEVMNLYVPKFILQPIIENSVTHGFSEKTDLCRIDIVGEIVQNELVIIVKDNGTGISHEKLESLKKMLASGGAYSEKSIGLNNVNTRIKLIYGSKYGVDVFNGEKTGTQVMIYIPICSEKKEDEHEEL